MDDDTPLAEGDARTLRFLKGLVTVLTVTMIGGVLAITALLVIRLNAAPGALPPLPDRIALPAGTEATAFTQGTGWIAVVTADDRILVFDREDGTLRQEVRIETAR